MITDCEALRQDKDYKYNIAIENGVDIDKLIEARNFAKENVPDNSSKSPFYRISSSLVRYKIKAIEDNFIYFKRYCDEASVDDYKNDKQMYQIIRKYQYPKLVLNKTGFNDRNTYYHLQLQEVYKLCNNRNYMTMIETDFPYITEEQAQGLINRVVGGTSYKSEIIKSIDFVDPNKRDDDSVFSKLETVVLKECHEYNKNQIKEYMKRECEVGPYKKESSVRDLVDYKERWCKIRSGGEKCSVHKQKN